MAQATSPTLWAQTDVTVYIGRFSPFHLGHAHVLRQALETSKLVIVLVGSSGAARSLKNPFTFAEREAMIQTWNLGNTSSGALRVLPLRDYPYNDALWTRSVQDKVKKCITQFCLNKTMILTDIRLTGSDRDETTWYLNAFPQWKHALVEPYRQNNIMAVSATEVREWMFNGAKGNCEHVRYTLPASTLNFITKFTDTEAYAQLVREYQQNQAYRKAWSAAPYAPTFNTVDAVVIQSGHILVVERGAEPGKGLWALPGGFLDQRERLQDGAIRELMEETGIRLAEGKKRDELTCSILKGSIITKEIFDKPDRSSRGRTITVAYLFRLDDTKPLPKVKGQNAPLHETNSIPEVETAKAFWIPLNEAMSHTDKWFEDHLSIVEWAATQKDDR